MISFSKLGNMGRLGNQLFQYAFIRGLARRLGVKFYCPDWIGDEVFLLNDQQERVSELPGIKMVYNKEPFGSLGFNQDVLNIRDHTDIQGYFMTEKYFFDKKAVHNWFRFRQECFEPVREKYRWIDFQNSCAVHLRFGDMCNIARVHTPSRRYYKQALTAARHKHHVLVFSDDMKKSKSFLNGLRSDLTFMEGNKNYEDLYLMSLCHDCICSLSSLSWWGAWLINYPDKIIICPSDRYTIGAPGQNPDFWPEEWSRTWSGRMLWHHYYLKYSRLKILTYLKKWRRWTKRLVEKM